MGIQMFGNNIYICCLQIRVFADSVVESSKVITSVTRLETTSFIMILCCWGTLFILE